MAPISRPPLEPPLDGEMIFVGIFLAIRYSAAAMKSSKTFCFLSSMPARCQSSPYSRAAAQVCDRVNATVLQP